MRGYISNFMIKKVKSHHVALSLFPSLIAQFGQLGYQQKAGPQEFFFSLQISPFLLLSSYQTKEIKSLPLSSFDKRAHFIYIVDNKISFSKIRALASQINYLYSNIVAFKTANKTARTSDFKGFCSTIRFIYIKITSLFVFPPIVASKLTFMYWVSGTRLLILAFLHLQIPKKTNDQCKLC